MIIIEGADSVGKTTLVPQLLEADPSLRLLRRERFKPERGEGIYDSYLGALLPADGDRLRHAHSLADRFLASECIYGELFRGGCRMSEGQHFALRNVLRSYGATVIHCDPPERAVRESWVGREQLYNEEDPMTIVRAYRERLRTIFAGFHVLRYDWTSPRAAQLRRQIVVAERERQRAHRTQLSWWSAMPFGAGRLYAPKIVMVGEGLSPLATTTVPFAHGPAGDFLAWAIAEAERSFGPIERDLYLTNADKGNGNDAALLREELRHLDLKPNARIVALGREAEDLLAYVKPEQRVEHLPHPQFWRRFHWPRRRDYVKQLIKVIS